MVARYIPQFIGLGVILAAWKLLGGESFLFAQQPKELEEKYDYIIVGGGTAGATLASRLSEQSNITVLLIEAGGNPKDVEEIEIPIMAEKARGSQFDWGYKTVPQRSACKGHEDGVSFWPSGKGLGGSSNINYMQYLRGSRHDYDEWAHNGCQGWAYKDILPYFIKSEDNHNGAYTRTVFHGFGGRMTITDVEWSPVTKIVTKAFTELGVKRRDTNGKNQFGYGHTQATIRNGLRCGTFRSFLKYAMSRDNLQVITNAMVTKVLFKGKQAAGVNFRVNGKDNIVKANKEIILAAGAIGTPKILMLSGIGPRQHLQQFKIPVVADLAVGDNLQDHVMANGVEFYTPHAVSITATKAENFVSSWQYALFGSGMKASPRFREGTAFVRVRHQPTHIKYPLLALHFVAGVGVYNPEQINVKENVWNAIHGDAPSKEGFTIYPVLLKPRSKGTIRLKSTNPEEPPLINPNYLSEDADAKILIEGIKIARRIFDTQVMRDWDFQLNNNLLPQCREYGNFTDDYLDCYIRQVTLSGYAPVGTCRMGAAGDPSAVVDPKMKVRGVKNLRIVDASIIPSAMSGNTYATQVMIAEKAADTILHRNTVQAIQEYFKHLMAIKHEKMAEEEDIHVIPIPKKSDH